MGRVHVAVFYLDNNLPQSVKLRKQHTDNMAQVINTNDLFIVHASGGAWEDAWYYEHVIVGRENADKAFNEAVKNAEDSEADYVTLESAYVTEEGLIRSKDSEPLRKWQY